MDEVDDALLRGGGTESKGILEERQRERSPDRVVTSRSH
jgi:hypothetical protein